MPALNPGLRGPFAAPFRRAFAPGAQSIMARAISILRRYGQDAHIYLPGVGMLNGLQAANYLDSAGTTQGTVDQPVGLVLDAAGGLGVELSPGTATTVGWSAINATVATSGGNIIATATVAGANAVQVYFDIATTIGSTYKLSEGVAGYTATLMTALRLRATTTAFTIIAEDFLAGPELGELHFVATSTTTRILARLDATFVSGVSTLTLNASSVREVTGIAASQPTTSAKPILRRGAVNLLTYSGDFSNAAWSLQMSATKSTNTVTFSANASSALELSQTISGGTASKTFTVAALISCASGTVAFRLKNTHATVVDNFSSELVATTTPQMFVFTVTNSAAAGNSAQTFALVNSATSPAIGTLISGGCAIFQGTYTAQQIQALGGIPLTTTAPASTALGPQYWQFDGSNDSLSLGGPLFQMADDHCVVAGVSPQSGATKVVVSPSFESASNYVGVIAFSSAGVLFADWCGAATSRQASDISTLTNTSVATARKSGVTKELRVNGVFKASNLLSATAGAASTTAYIGSFGGASLYSSGAIYPVIAIKGTVSDPDLLLLEKMVANLSGVTL